MVPVGLRGRLTAPAPPNADAARHVPWGVRRVLDTIGGLYQLARLAVVSRFNFRGPYWTWRLHTAFGRGYPESRWEMVRAVMDYARWVHRMRRNHG